LWDEERGYYLFARDQPDLILANVLSGASFAKLMGVDMPYVFGKNDERLRRTLKAVYRHNFEEAGLGQGPVNLARSDGKEIETPEGQMGEVWLGVVGVLDDLSQRVGGLEKERTKMLAAVERAMAETKMRGRRPEAFRPLGKKVKRPKGVAEGPLEGDWYYIKAIIGVPTSHARWVCAESGSVRALHYMRQGAYGARLIQPRKAAPVRQFNKDVNRAFAVLGALLAGLVLGHLLGGMELPGWINVAGYVFGFPATLLFGTRGVVTFVNRVVEWRSLPSTPEQVLALQTFLASHFPKARVELGPVGAEARAHTTRYGAVVFSEELAKGPMTSFKMFELNYLIAHEKLRLRLGWASGFFIYILAILSLPTSFWLMVRARRMPGVGATEGLSLPLRALATGVARRENPGVFDQAAVDRIIAGLVSALKERRGRDGAAFDEEKARTAFRGLVEAEMVTADIDPNKPAVLVDRAGNVSGLNIFRIAQALAANDQNKAVLVMEGKDAADTAAALSALSREKPELKLAVEIILNNMSRVRVVTVEPGTVEVDLAEALRSAEVLDELETRGMALRIVTTLAEAGTWDIRGLPPTVQELIDYLFTVLPGVEAVVSRGEMMRMLEEVRVTETHA